MAERHKPTVRLSGENGNAFMIIGLCQRAAREAGWTDDEVKEIRDRMFAAGSYDKLLQIAITEFEVY